jgi:hypothetical protein
VGRGFLRPSRDKNQKLGIKYAPDTRADGAERIGYGIHVQNVQLVQELEKGKEKKKKKKPI